MEPPKGRLKCFMQISGHEMAHMEAVALPMPASASAPEWIQTTEERMKSMKIADIIAVHGFDASTYPAPSRSIRLTELQA